MRMGCLAVHYGKEYLPWAVRGLAGACDEVHVFYSAAPSFGFSEGVVCPDTRDELYEAANRFAPVVWHDITARSEAAHRTQMLTCADKRGAQLVAIADADEIWDPATLTTAFDAVWEANRAGRWLARFCHFWRSWSWTVADSFRPIRIVDRRHPLNRDDYLTETMQPVPVFHFGYAQTLQTMAYKFTCHGHKAEFRPRWWEDKFLAWKPDAQTHDIHPCVNHLWESALPTDPALRAQLEALAGDHPHKGLDLIT